MKAEEVKLQTLSKREEENKKDRLKIAIEMMEGWILSAAKNGNGKEYLWAKTYKLSEDNIPKFVYHFTNNGYKVLTKKDCSDDTKIIVQWCEEECPQCGRTHEACK